MWVWLHFTALKDINSHIQASNLLWNVLEGMLGSARMVSDQWQFRKLITIVNISFSTVFPESWKSGWSMVAKLNMSLWTWGHSYRAAVDLTSGLAAGFCPRQMVNSVFNGKYVITMFHQILLRTIQWILTFGLTSTLDSHTYAHRLTVSQQF